MKLLSKGRGRESAEVRYLERGKEIVVMGHLVMGEETVEEHCSVRGREKSDVTRIVSEWWMEMDYC